MYYTAGGQAIYQAGGQNYILASANPSAGAVTTTGAPVIYSSGPVLHNGAGQQHAGQTQQQLAYQMVNANSNASLASQQATSTAGPGVVAQQPPQLVQRSNVVQQVRHHPYRN